MPVEIGWEQEDQEDDEVSGPSEETRTPVKMNDPHAPSQKERGAARDDPSAIPKLVLEVCLRTR